MLTKLIGKFGGITTSKLDKSSTIVPEDASYSLFFNRLESGNIERFIGLRPRLPSLPQYTFSLTEFRVDAVISDAIVTTVMTQQYKNDSTTPVEAKYEMPLPPYAAVNKFIVTFDDKVLFAKIKERQAAQEKYDDAIASGNQAFLVEKNSSGTFSTVIGNIPPGKEVTVSITTVAEIGTLQEELHFGLHRYMFPQDKKFNFSLNLNVQLSTPIDSLNLEGGEAGVWSVKDKKVQDNNGTLKLSSSEGVKKNLIISIKPKSNNDRPSYFLEKSGEADSTDGAIALNFYPTLKVAPEDIDQHGEFIFLIDCSGSMAGGQIAKAKSALEILMRSLTEKTKFNIWLFGSSYRSLFPESRIYSDATLEEATHFITKIDANLGGTVLYDPLKAILGKTYDPQYPRQLFILTDGEVSDRDKTIDVAGKESLSTRIFTLGIGSGVDRNLVVGLSKACLGYYDFIDSNNEMETRVMKLMSIAMEPMVSNIKVEWDGLEATQAPKVVRPIYNHQRMLIHGLIKSMPTEGIKNIIISGDGPTGERLTYEVPVDFSQAQSTGKSLQTLTAHLIIRDLEQEADKLGNKNKNKEEIITLGKKYSLVSNHTSFVVVSESDTPVEETMKTVNILQEPQVQPQQQFYPMAPGGGGRGGAPLRRSAAAPTTSNRMFVKQSQLSTLSSVDRCAPMSSSSMSSPPPPLSAPRAASIDDSFADYDDCSSGSEDEDSGYILEGSSFGGGELKKNSAPAPLKAKKKLSKDTKCEESESTECRERKSSVEKCKPTSINNNNNNTSTLLSGPPAPQRPPAPKQFISTGNLMMDLIRMQNANGSWGGNLPFKVPAVPDELASLVDVWTTLLVVGKLSKDFSDKKTQWQQIVNKALKWVKSQLTTAGLSDKYDSLKSKAESSV